MIEFRHLTKAYRTTRGSKVIVDELTLTLPSGREGRGARPQRRRQVDADRA